MNVSEVWQVWGGKKRNCFLGKKQLPPCLCLSTSPTRSPASRSCTWSPCCLFSAASTQTGPIHRRPAGGAEFPYSVKWTVLRGWSQCSTSDPEELLVCQWTRKQRSFIYWVLFPIATHLQIFTLSKSSNYSLYLWGLCWLILSYPILSYPYYFLVNQCFKEELSRPDI